MDAALLDLCISCGSHVADGTPYCSARCQNQDATAFYPQQSGHASSSSQRFFPSASSSSAPYRYNPHRRPLLDLHEPSIAYQSQEEVAYTPPSAQKLASIAEWAKGVWGDAGDDEDEDVLRMRARKTAAAALPTPIPSKKISSPKSSPSRSSHRSQGSLSSYTPPRFTLTAQHLAPPAMSIAATSNLDDDLSSIRTPSSRASSRKSSSPRKETVDPWISSPPYEFAHTHFVAAQRTSSPLHIQERGRTLVRV